MTTQHTPEPWELNVYGDKDSPQGLTAIRGGGGVRIAEDLAQKNAQRIVACVNGCAGIPDPETTIPDLIQALREIRDLAHKSYLWQAQDKARAVLAKLDKDPTCRVAHDDWSGPHERERGCPKGGQQG